jgi:exopolyphosphatase/guanosine-5'-triphosphate,3'-diphosphate pyrophosphatase
MSERHFANDPATPEQIELARTDIQAAIDLAAAEVPITKAKTLVAVAGTATTVAAAALELAEYDRYAIHLARISASQVHDVSAMFLTRNREQRLTLGYMHPGRVDVIPAGGLVLSEIMKATGATEFVASESDILDGMARSLVQG